MFGFLYCLRSCTGLPPRLGLVRLSNGVWHPIYRKRWIKKLDSMIGLCEKQPKKLSAKNCLFGKYRGNPHFNSAKPLKSLVTPTGIEPVFQP
jgi:hypothetical protein